MTGVGLEPTTNGLTCRIGFRRPSRRRMNPIRDVDGLDSPIAIAGGPGRPEGDGTKPGGARRMSQSRRPTMGRGIGGLALIAVGLGATVAIAGEPAFKAVPARAELRGPDAVQQLTVEGPNGLDLTGL